MHWVLNLLPHDFYCPNLSWIKRGWGESECKLISTLLLSFQEDIHHFLGTRRGSSHALYSHSPLLIWHSPLSSPALSSEPLHQQNEKIWRNYFSSLSFNSVSAHGEEQGGGCGMAREREGGRAVQVFIISGISISLALAFITGNTMAPAKALNTLSPVFFRGA